MDKGFAFASKIMTSAAFERDEFGQKELVSPPKKNAPITPVTVSSGYITNIYSKIMSKVQLKDFYLVGCRQF